MPSLIPVQYHKKRYPPHITPKLTEVAGHFDKTQIDVAGAYSLHTEYSYTKRDLNSSLLSQFPEIRAANKRKVPRLWYNDNWTMEFVSFIQQITRNNSPPKVIEIHPPFIDYCGDLASFLDRYTPFEESIIKAFPNTEIVLENRCGTQYHGGVFLISKLLDIEKLVAEICRRGLLLMIALDIPQLLTAEGDSETLTNEGMRCIFGSLENIREHVRSLHLWGKKRNKKGTRIAHQGDLNTYFDGDDSLKRLFLSELHSLLDDARQRYFVPEVNSKTEDLCSIVQDLESVGIRFV